MLRLIAAFIVAALLAGTPSGRPPTGPLHREDPKIHDFSMQVTVSTVHQHLATDRRWYTLEDAPIVVPLIFQGTYSRIDPDSLAGQLWLGEVEDKTLNQRSRIDENLPHHTHLAVMPIARYQGPVVRWKLSYRVQTWSSKVLDEAAMARIAWPLEWPDEVRDGLKAQRFIESDDEIFKRAVEHASGGQLRMVPPYLAAKDLVRYCINQIEASGDGVRKEEMGVLRGLEMAGARQAVAEGRGGPHDLLCVCIATLRAAGIPARPVIGVEEKKKSKATFVSWGEFYLPQVGWVPFDPFEMRGKGVRHMDVRQPWPEFGTMKNLNERIPLAYHFIPAQSVETPGYPAVWGWDPRPGGDPSSVQQIDFVITSRGQGVDDPQ